MPWTCVSPLGLADRSWTIGRDFICRGVGLSRHGRHILFVGHKLNLNHMLGRAGYMVTDQNVLLPIFKLTKDYHCWFGIEQKYTLFESTNIFTKKPPG